MNLKMLGKVLDNHLKSLKVRLTQGLDDAVDGVNDPIGRHQVRLDHGDLVGVDGVVPLKHKDGPFSEIHHREQDSLNQPERNPDHVQL